MVPNRRSLNTGEQILYEVNCQKRRAAQATSPTHVFGE